MHTRRLATKTATALLATPPSTRHHPLTPVTVPCSPAVPCSEYTYARQTKEEKRKKGLKMPKKIKKTKNRWKGPARNNRRRLPRGSSERPGMYQNRARSESEISTISSSIPGICLRVTLSGPQSRFGDKSLGIRVVYPRVGTAVLKGLSKDGATIMS